MDLARTLVHSATTRALKARLRAAKARSVDHSVDLLDFIRLVTPRHQRPTHLAPIAEQLARTEHDEVRALVNAPPRHGKTELLLHFAAWYIARHPDRTVGYASHSASLAWSKSRLARDYARIAGVQLRDDADAVSEWRTAEGGGCLAAGVLGSWTGHGVHVLLVDDPYADRKDAESPLVRRRVVEWYQSVANTRIEPGGSILVSHTRWHEHDLSGWIKSPDHEDRDRYAEVNLPAIDAEGHALWPKRWPLAALERKKRGVGPYEWAALYQGHPVPKGGEVFKAPTFYEHASLDGARVVIGCDCAGTTGASSDYTAAVVLAVRIEKNEPVADVLEVVRMKAEAGAVAAKLEALQTQYHAPLTIEATRDGKQVVRSLQSINPRLRIHEVAPYASKYVRAQPVAGAWNAQRVRVPRAAAWLSDFLFEVSKFTGLGDRHDDQCDALAYAWAAAAERPRNLREHHYDL